MRALVIDPGNSRSALAGVRALAAAGWDVGVAGTVRGMAGRSRWSTYERVASTTDVAELDRVVRSGRYDVVVPAGDAEAFVVSRDRGSLSCRVPYADHWVVMTAFDKLALTKVAVECGVPVPEEANGDKLPVVVKGRSHVNGRNEAVVATTREELFRAMQEMDEPFLQEFVKGPLVSMAVVADSTSRVMTRVQQRALAVWPSPAGVSTRAVTELVNPELAETVDRLVARLGWVGLAQFQFVGGKLIDCNGRLYGSLSLAVAAGVNLPAIWLGWPAMTGREAKAYVHYQWLEGDLRRAPLGALSTLGFALGANHSIWNRKDMRPFVGHVAGLGLRLVRKAFRP